MGTNAWPRFFLAAVAAYLVVVTTLTVLFGNPVIDRILFTDKAGQSDKVLSVWLEQEPLPAVTPRWNEFGDIDGRFVAVQGMLLAWSTAMVWVYTWGWAARSASVCWRGLTFGVAMWAVVFLFFEAWVPFNVLGEPFHLVLVELGLQLVSMIATGIAIALIMRSPRNSPTIPLELPRSGHSRGGPEV